MDSFYIALFLFLNIINNGSSFFFKDLQMEKDIIKWKQTVSLVTFDQTINSFPYLIENINAIKINNLFQQGGCKYQFQPARFLIINNKVFSYGSMKSHERVRNYESFLKGLTVIKNLPDMYFIIHFYDQLVPQLIEARTHEICKQIPLFIFNKNCSSSFQKTKFLLPDPFITLNLKQSIKQIKQAAQKNPWQKKLLKLFFRGIPSAPHFYDMKIDQNVNLFKYFHRGAYILLSFKYPERIEANFTKFPSPLSGYIEKRIGVDRKIFSNQVSMSQHLKYRYLLSAAGTGASWKRVPMILFSNSLLFKPYSEKIQWFYGQLIPHTHFVQIKDDLSDLFCKMNLMENDKKKAFKIIQKANQFAENYLTQAAINNFTINILEKYAKIQNLILTPQEKQKIMSGVDIQIVLKEKIVENITINQQMSKQVNVRIKQKQSNLRLK